ncbi:hypothetical protein A4A49_55256 [Nicotiana attenuata]|uniref:DUF4283 domain-containing protein n=1 Tax=Nicotiana attenuata TaxID=49451 RepID=A0A1J6KMN7_NICAT|nr:hypothetical protein A4A49_55256 [Nicotiana attenuata]
MPRGRPAKVNKIAAKNAAELLKEAIGVGPSIQLKRSPTPPLNVGQRQIGQTPMTTPIPKHNQQTPTGVTTAVSSNRKVIMEVTPTNQTIMKVGSKEANLGELHRSESKVEVAGDMQKQREMDASQAEEKPKTWATLFNGNKFAARGMELKYITPIIVEGELVAQSQQEELDREIGKWKHALIMYVVRNSPTIAAMERFIASNWNYIAKPKVYYHNEGFFLVKFGSIDDKDEVNRIILGV